MAKLYINKDIVADKDKMINWYLTGDEGMSFSDVQSFIDWMDTNDTRIDLELHSCGGRCDEGYAIYDALRATGKEISAKVVGKCASMATVILLAAPKERRTAHEHAQFLIHSPYYPEGGISGSMTSDELRNAAEALEAEKEKMLALYEERTEVSRKHLEEQMAVGDWFDSERAVELGFISSIIQPASASASNNPLNNINMDKSKRQTVAQALRALGAALGISKEDTGAVAQDITTSTGNILTVEREEGEIQVGDKASPDGEHVLEDGTKVTVKDGTITEIKTPEEGGDDIEALKAEIERLKAENQGLKANAKSTDDAEILAIVHDAGGMAFFEKLASTYVPAGKSTQSVGKKKEDANEPVSFIEQQLAAKRAEKSKKFKTV